jgi:hypothetical protein
MTHPGVRLAFCGSLLLSLLAFPAVSQAEEIPCEWSGIAKTIVIGDIHGDYESFLKILKGTGVVDQELHWAAGKAHFVQTGDVMDRGDDARRIFDLLIRLEKEAEEAGGMVHVLLGNHEEMNLTGIVFDSDPDYVTLDQFISFLPEGFRTQQEEVLSKKILKAQARNRRTQPDSIMNEFWNSLRRNPSTRRLYTLNLNEEYGPWLRRLNVAIKINDVVFVHGGISEKYSKWGLKEINDRYRLELANIWREFERPGLQRDSRPSIVPPSIVYRRDSPLWYRELATVPEEDLKEEVDAILRNLGAKAMIIAHTPKIARSPRDMQRFGGRVWIVDTGIARAYGGPASALIIQNGDFNVWGVGDENDNDSKPSFLSLDLAWGGHLDPVPAGR